MGRGHDDRAGRWPPGQLCGRQRVGRATPPCAGPAGQGDSSLCSVAAASGAGAPGWPACPRPERPLEGREARPLPQPALSMRMSARGPPGGTLSLRRQGELSVSVQKRVCQRQLGGREDTRRQCRAAPPPAARWPSHPEGARGGGRHTRRGHRAGGCTEAGPGPQTPCRPLPPEAQCSQRPSGSANTPSRPLLCVEMAQCQAPEIPGAQAQLQGARR